jgi:hypothetical protein
MMLSLIQIDQNHASEKDLPIAKPPCAYSDAPGLLRRAAALSKMQQA